MKKMFLFSLLMGASLLAQESWKVDEHPALLSRLISGFTEPSAVLEIKAEYAGRLLELKYDEGALLTAQNAPVLVARQDGHLAQLELGRAQAALRSQQALLEKRESEKQVQERVAAHYEREMKRLSKLAEKGQVPRSQFDLVKFDYERAKLQIKDFDAAIAVQKAAIKEAEVAVAQAQEVLSRYDLHAPSGWVVNKRLVEQGAWLRAGETLYQLVNLQELSVYLRLSAEELSAVRKGDFVLTDKQTRKSLKARVHHIDLSFDPASRKRLVELRLDAQQFTQASGGIELELQLELPYPRPAVFIPSRFVFRKLEQDTVRLATGEEIALTPLRRVAEGIIVERSDLPAEAVLTEVANP